MLFVSAMFATTDTPTPTRPALIAATQASEVVSKSLVTLTSFLASMVTPWPM